MAESSARPCRVLIANQAREVCHYLAVLLRQEGYETVEVDAGPAALEVIRQRSVDVAVIDLLLPGVNALLASRKASGDLPVIVASSGSARPASEVREQWGAAGYLALPAGREEVLEAVRQVLPGCSPRPADDPPSGGGEAAAAEGGGGGERGTILLVEDNDKVRFLVREVLMMSGYSVLEAESSADALRACAAHTGSVDLLVADVLLPGMTGPQLFQQLALRYPGLRVLYLSGLPAGELADRGWLKAAVPLLEKPFMPTALLAKVGAVLSGPPPC